MQKNEQLLILNHVVINSRLYSITASTWSQINQHQQMFEQDANNRQRIRWPRAAPLLTQMMRYDGVSSLWLQRWHLTCVQVASFVRHPSASGTLVLCHGMG